MCTAAQKTVHSKPFKVLNINDINKITAVRLKI
jgi:hypothetical protein